tara:strand:+ start:7242 stop:7457 length:216 start_codon:yes stop_codon:yes gene_type:complete
VLRYGTRLAGKIGKHGLADVLDVRRFSVQLPKRGRIDEVDVVRDDRFEVLGGTGSPEAVQQFSFVAHDLPE